VQAAGTLLSDMVALLMIDTNSCVSGQVWDQLQKPHWRKGILQSKSDADIFGDLLRSVEARYSLLESTLGANDLEQHCQAASDIKLHYASVDGICVEYRHANVLPFDFSLTSEVFWTSLLDGKIGTFDCPSTVSSAR
jgi:hypothetical protein